MNLRTPFRPRYLLLALSLGLVPLACDGEVDDNQFPCTGSQPIDSLGQDTGYEACGNGARHRPQILTCNSGLPRADTCMTDAMLGTDACNSDADCTDQTHGLCSIQGQVANCFCSYGCVEDAECAAGQICLCGEPVGFCVSADCKSDADCDGDLLCVSYTSDPGCGGTAFVCQTPQDECASDGDCSDGATCTHNGSKLVCQQANCVIGRPFLVDGHERMADAARRADWCDAPAPSLAGLDQDTRAALCEHWTQIALMEHASVAAFARFSLQLLAQGAPTQLLIDTSAAMIDETRHAKICFRLASVYGDRPIGPGALLLDGALRDHDDVETVFRLAILEGCIGETVAALEAAEAARHATDPVLSTSLAAIAEDEMRHATLAWRYVAWVLSRQPSLANVLLATIDSTILESRTNVASAPDDRLLAYGVVGETVRAEIRRRALAEIIRPCAVGLTRRRTRTRTSDLRAPDLQHLA